MEFFDVVRRRHSYRGPFLEKHISDDELRKIVDAGIRAPSGMNAQTTSFMAITDRALLMQIAAAFPTPAVKTAPAIIVVLTEPVVTPCGLTFEVEDYAASVMSMLLAITALGYATVWMDGATRSQEGNQALRKLLHVPAGKTIRTILPIGAPAITIEQNTRKPLEERCVFNHF